MIFSDLCKLIIYKYIWISNNTIDFSFSSLHAVIIILSLTLSFIDCTSHILYLFHYFLMYYHMDIWDLSEFDTFSGTTLILKSFFTPHYRNQSCAHVPRNNAPSGLTAVFSLGGFAVLFYSGSGWTVSLTLGGNKCAWNISDCGATMAKKHWRTHTCVSSTPQQLEQKYWRIWYFQVKRIWLLANGAAESIFVITSFDLLVRYWSIHHSWWTHSFWGRCWKQVRLYFLNFFLSKLRYSCCFLSSLTWSCLQFFP